jgi:hypothetical protein
VQLIEKQMLDMHDGTLTMQVVHVLYAAMMCTSPSMLVVWL